MDNAKVGNAIEQFNTGFMITYTIFKIWYECKLSNYWCNT